MKKAMTLLLSAVLMLSLAACGGNGGDINTPSGDNNTPTTQGDNATTPEATEMSKEEMLAVAEDINYDEILAAFTENELRARQLIETYIGSTIVYSDFVETVGNDAAIIGQSTIYLKADDLIQLNKGEKVLTVGIVDDISLSSTGYTNRTQTVNGITTSESIPNLILTITLKNAYIVGNTFEVTGILSGGWTNLITSDGTNKNRQGDPDAWYLELIDDNGIEYDIIDDVQYEYDDANLGNWKITSLTIGGQEIQKVTLDNSTHLGNINYVTVSGKINLGEDKLQIDGSYIPSYIMSDVTLVEIP